MFDIGLKDILTVRKYTSASRTQGNKNFTWATLINAQHCRKVTSTRTETDETGAKIVVKEEHVIVNYTGTDIDEKCEATLNGVQYEIIRVDPAEGFGRNFLSIVIKGRE